MSSHWEYFHLSLSFSAITSLGPGHTKLSFYLPLLFQIPESSNIPILLKGGEIGKPHGLSSLLASSPCGVSPCRSDVPLPITMATRVRVGNKESGYSIPSLPQPQSQDYILGRGVPHSWRLRYFQEDRKS